uniref:Uncharacterized protein n=1 Tax=Anguilla anguilla TaxID=7936 RepID=A0A0E9X342_ANGAN
MTGPHFKLHPISDTKSELNVQATCLFRKDKTINGRKELKLVVHSGYCKDCYKYEKRTLFKHLKST